MHALGEETHAEARVYLTGGATAVLHGWRTSTIDIDIKIVPDVDAVFRAIPVLKERLQINVELAAPDDFIRCVMDGRIAARSSSGKAACHSIILISTRRRSRRLSAATSRMPWTLRPSSIESSSIARNCWRTSKRSSRGCTDTLPSILRLCGKKSSKPTSQRP